MEKLPQETNKFREKTKIMINIYITKVRKTTLFEYLFLEERKSSKSREILSWSRKRLGIFPEEITKH